MQLVELSNSELRSEVIQLSLQNEQSQVAIKELSEKAKKLDKQIDENDADGRKMMKM